MVSTDSADPRLTQLRQWLDRQGGAPVRRVAPASADASFRRYFRVWRDGTTQIAMDAPPGREELGSYVRVAGLLAAAGANVPQVLAADEAQGFLLLTDLGSRQYLDALRDGEDPDALYGDAIDALVRFQRAADAAARALPPYDRGRLAAEMALFPEWFLQRHLQLETNAAEQELIDATFALLCDEALAQPAVLVHRDYHSRNLMVCPGANPGILDFQDAVSGPVSYDLVSLLKDCYIVWPRQRMLGWLDLYLERAARAGIDTGGDRAAFLRRFELMGLQRHIKVLGIFARLWYRDSKPAYLGDLPRVLDYALEACAAEPALAGFRDFLEQRVAPAFVAAQHRVGAVG